MTQNIIKCPKCKNSKLVLTEVSELQTSYPYNNGKLTATKNENISEVLKITAFCENKSCRHEWTLKKIIHFDLIPLELDDNNIIEYNCISCGNLKKIKILKHSKFNPKINLCSECEIESL